MFTETDANMIFEDVFDDNSKWCEALFLNILNFFEVGRGQNVTSDVSTQLWIKSFLNANLSNKCDERAKSVIHASNHFHQKTFFSFQMLSKVSPHVVLTAHFDF